MHRDFGASRADCRDRRRGGAHDVAGSRECEGPQYRDCDALGDVVRQLGSLTLHGLESGIISLQGGALARAPPG